MSEQSYELCADDDMGIDEIVACLGGGAYLHMEALSKDTYWFALCFGEGRERLTWTVSRKGRGLRCTVVERPAGVADLTKPDALDGGAA